MLKNNNQEIVRKIAFRSMKQNRIRNGIVILAVILTTFMFTTIFTIGASMAEGMMVMLTRQQGTRSSIYLQNRFNKLQTIMIFMLLGCKFRPEQHTIRKMKPLQFCSVITMRPNLKRISRLPSAIFVAIIQQIPPQLCFLKMHWKPCRLKRQK